MNLITSIESFNFKLGGYFSSKYEVSFEKNFITYIAQSSPLDIGLKYEKEISTESFEIFKSKLNELNLITWQNEYYSPALDAEEWHLDIKYNNSCIKNIEGMNGYPGNVSNIDDRTEIFNELLLAIETLLQEPAVFN